VLKCDGSRAKKFVGEKLRKWRMPILLPHMMRIEVTCCGAMILLLFKCNPFEIWESLFGRLVVWDHKSFSYELESLRFFELFTHKILPLWIYLAYRQFRYFFVGLGGLKSQVDVCELRCSCGILGHAINRTLDIIFVSGGKIKHLLKYMLFKCVGTTSFYGYFGGGSNLFVYQFWVLCLKNIVVKCNIVVVSRERRLWWTLIWSRHNLLQVRYLTLLIIGEPFMRSKLFRTILVESIDQLLSLSVGFRRNLPLLAPPFVLRSKAIEFLEKWNSSFGIHYRQLRLLLDCQRRRISLPLLCPGNLIRIFLATNEILIYLVLHISCIILI
jgi:hypothetical protein